MKGNVIFCWFVTFIGMLIIWSPSVSCLVPHSSARLEELKVRKQRFSTQFVFDFSSAPECRSRALEKQNLFELEFRGSDGKDFDVQQVVRKISALPLVEDVSISVSDTPIKSVRLAIRINPREVSVRVSQYRDLNQVVLDVYSKRSLEKLVDRAKLLEVASAHFPLQRNFLDVVWL